MTALLDWELAHLGDPMEDIAWFSMRCVMEPVPDFAERITEYERLAGRAIDKPRVLYHRVLVSTRIVIIRHRNVTGEPGNSIVSRGLNRRLLIDALAAAMGVRSAAAGAGRAPATDRTELYDGVIDDLRAKMAERSDDAVVIASAKNAAKVLKYLRDSDRLGPAPSRRPISTRCRRARERRRPRCSTARRRSSPGCPLAASRHDVLGYFAGMCRRARRSSSAASSGGLAGRTFPDLP